MVDLKLSTVCYRLALIKHKSSFDFHPLLIIAGRINSGESACILLS